MKTVLIVILVSILFILFIFGFIRLLKQYLISKTKERLDMFDFLTESEKGEILNTTKEIFNDLV